MQTLFETGDVLRGFVDDTGNRVGVIEEALYAVRRCHGGRTGAVASCRSRRALRVLRRNRLLRDVEDLSFDNAAHFIQIGAALALDFRTFDGLAPQPDNNSDDGYDDEAGNRQDFTPVRQKTFQRPPLRAPIGSLISPSVSRAFSQSFRND